MTFDFAASSPLPVRDDLRESFQSTWTWIAQPGNWWSGSERVAIAAETRMAWTCTLCTERKTALSPAMVSGAHDRHDSILPEIAVEAVHRLITDATRLSRSWLDTAAQQGLTDAHYVELMGVALMVYSVDRFHQALGIELEQLPAAQPGEPTGYRPASAADDHAWVPMIAEKDAAGDEHDLYHGSGAPNVVRAMSLVPDCVRQLKVLSATMYIPLEQLTNVSADPGRALDREQIELLSGRVSALNECFY